MHGRRDATLYAFWRSSGGTRASGSVASLYSCSRETSCVASGARDLSLYSLVAGSISFFAFLATCRRPGCHVPHPCSGMSPAKFRTGLCQAGWTALPAATVHFALMQIEEPEGHRP